MKREQVDWHSGRVVFWDLDFFDAKIPLEVQIDDLKEDLAQILYPHGVLIDIGWYPEFALSGAFVVRVVRETKWDEPLLLEEYKSADELLKGLVRTVLVAEQSAQP